MLASLCRQESTQRLFSIVAILLSYLPFVFTTSPVICYDASGSPDDSYVACDPTGVTTHACCVPDDICFQNGLCVGSLGAGATPYYTSKCTNPTYNATGCFKNCNDGIYTPHKRSTKKVFQLTNSSGWKWRTGVRRRIEWGILLLRLWRM